MGFTKNIGGCSRKFRGTYIRVYRRYDVNRTGKDRRRMFIAEGAEIFNLNHLMVGKRKAESGKRAIHFS